MLRYSRLEPTHPARIQVILRDQFNNTVHETFAGAATSFELDFSVTGSGLLRTTQAGPGGASTLTLPVTSGSGTFYVASPVPATVTLTTTAIRTVTGTTPPLPVGSVPAMRIPPARTNDTSIAATLG